jgi:hypothetical protein
MKKLIVASALVLAGTILVSSPALRAQDPGQITIQDPAEFNAFQNASTQSDPAAQSAALESFLSTYPQSVAKKNALDALIDSYQKANQPEKALSAAARMLQLDANNFKAIVLSVFVKKFQCGKSLDPSGVTTDPQTCDDAGALALRGLNAPKPADISDDDWKKTTINAYPLFHSAIAYDDVVSKKDYKGGIDEYTKELMLYPVQATTVPGPGLQDTLQLAQAYAKPGDSRDAVKAIWFFARAWNFAPANFKAPIQEQLEYWYKRYHGKLDASLDAVKTASTATLFPPADFTIEPAPTPAKLAHEALVGGDPSKLNLEDKEFILANGVPEDADKLWGLLKGQETPVPGNVIATAVTALKVTVTGAAPKPKEFVVKLATPATCASISVPADAAAYLQANGVKADVDALGDALTGAKKIVVEPVVGAIGVAVTNDAKENHKADFIVNLKSPASCRAVPSVGSALALQPAKELDGVYDTYAKVPETGSVQIVLRDGLLQEEKKAAPAPAHHAGKPAA